MPLLIIKESLTKFIYRHTIIYFETNFQQTYPRNVAQQSLSISLQTNYLYLFHSPPKQYSYQYTLVPSKAELLPVHHCLL